MAFGGVIPPLEYLSLIGRIMEAGAETAHTNNGVIEEITNNVTWRTMIWTSGGRPYISSASSYPSQQYSLPVPRKDMILGLPGKLRGRLLIPFISRYGHNTNAPRDKRKKKRKQWTASKTRSAARLILFGTDISYFFPSLFCTCSLLPSVSSNLPI